MNQPSANDLAHRLIELQAAQRPAATAVRHLDRRLDYASLNAAANRLAHWLALQSLPGNSAVLVCLEPGCEIEIALLAVLKSGHIYVPVDPGYPPARLAAIMQDTRPAAVISQSALARKLPESAAQVFCFDRDAAELEAQSMENLDTEPRSGDTAYIFYTSGSTGQPKGVVASHANLAHYLRSARERYGFDAGVHMPAIARFSFSISLFELLTPLTAGGSVLILDREHILDPQRMTRTLEDVTFFHAGPSLLRVWTRYIGQHHRGHAAYAGVRHASAGGDIVAPDLLATMQELFPNAGIFVIYGSSEISCMGCTLHLPPGHRIVRPTIGRPFADVTVRLCDAGYREVADGEAGEICVAGGGVVTGYLNLPELTREKFVELDGQRYYCTGDQGRRNAAGDVEFLGRRDFQVQLRGMRVELGDVEAALRGAPGVREAVALAQDDASGEKTLVGFVVLEGGAKPDLEAVRQHVLTQLPDYMVPSRLVPLDALPLNHNLKVDRQALARRQPDTGAGAACASEPVTPTERAVVAACRRLLGNDQVGTADNFFESGGHSILAIELLLEIEVTLGVRLEGMDVLRESLEVLAREIDRRRGVSPPSGARRRPPVAPAEVSESFYFGPGDSLYGTVHRPSGAGASTAVLICAPPGQEQVRSHFVLQRLSRQLARRGAAVLRFDHFGCGDSLGIGTEVGAGRWQEDIAAAAAELRRRSGQQRPAAIGVRLGGTLLWNAHHAGELQRVVLWDPVVDGARHLLELRRMTAQRARERHGVRLGRNPPIRPGTHELLGFVYADELHEQLQSLCIRSDRRPSLDVRGLFTAQGESSGALPLSGKELLGFDCRWCHPASLEDVLPDAGISAALMRLVLP